MNQTQKQTNQFLTTITYNYIIHLDMKKKTRDNAKGENNSPFDDQYNKI